MKKIWFLGIILLLTGCSTYVGSRDLVEKDPAFDDVAHAEKEGKTYGFALSMRQGVVTLQFGTGYDRHYRRTQQCWKIGREYFYLDKKIDEKTNNVFEFWQILAFPVTTPLGVVLWPLVIGADQIDLWSGKPWHYCGEYPPGIGYQIAYVPPVSWLTGAFLRPPYAYREARFVSEKEFWEKKELVLHQTEIRQAVFEPDVSGSEVRLEGALKKLTKSSGADGRISFQLAKLVKIGSGETVEFTVHHRNSGRKWRVTLTPVVTPEELRDWNIAANNGWDPYARMHALLRMKKVFGPAKAKALARKLLMGQNLDLTPIPAGLIKIK